MSKKRKPGRGYKDDYYAFGPAVFAQTFTVIGRKHYPHRVPPKEWPSKEIVGKAIARGWAVPCRYYPRMRGRGGYCLTYVYPGVSDAVRDAIYTIMRKEENDVKQN